MAADLCGLLKERVIILDGAMGTMLQSMGMATGQSTEWYGVNNPDVLQDIHYNYIEAGADIIETNTFGANRLKLDIFGLGAQTRDINMEAVNIAKKAAGGKALVAGSIGPTGQLLKPMGTADYKKLFSVYSEQVQALAQAGVDLISIETMLDIGEMKIASIAVKQNTRLPIIAHMTFEQENRSMTGTDPLTALIIMEALQPLAFGANCSGGAKELLPVIEQLRRNTNSYLTVEPNAGLPYLVEGETFFPDTPEEMAEYALRLYEAGANIIGGCCGTTPQHIQAMARALKGVRPKSISHEPLRALASRSRTVVIAPEAPLAFIGERINPTARKQLAHDIKDAKMKLVVAEAKKQVQSGAPILDINMGVPGVDEPSAMSLAVALVQNAVDVPISIDSTNAAAIEEGLQNFVGRALINSTTGEQKSLEKILPLAQQYGAAVLGLCIDENGIPKTQEKRLQIAQRIYDAAKKYGLRDQDIYIDCLVQTASAEQSQIMETLQSVSLIKSRLQVGIVLGISNVSHGLPVRENINAVFLSMALAAGLDLPIINPFDERIMDTCRSAEVILNRDPSCLNYIRYYGQKNISSNKEEKVLRHIICSECNIPELLKNETSNTILPPKSTPDPLPNEKTENNEFWENLQKTILEGNTDDMCDLIQQALDLFAPLEVINKGLIPGIEQAGDLYEKKLYFLPQLMLSAEAMKKAFSIVKPLLKQEDDVSQGTVVLATVKGDIHDIGKNIVAVMLENYGFKVIDLGKDVNTEEIIKAAQNEKADIIGLSALMTTTMPAMSEIVKEVRERKLSCKVLIGGAVLNQDYADHIGADAYGKDARQAVIKAKELMKEVHQQKI